jgi:hypothetical protein
MFRARVETGSTAGLSSVGNSVAKSFRKVRYRSLPKTSLYLLITPCTVLSENHSVSLLAQRRAAALSVVLSGFGLSAFFCAFFPSLSSSSFSAEGDINRRGDIGRD